MAVSSPALRRKSRRGRWTTSRSGLVLVRGVLRQWQDQLPGHVWAPELLPSSATHRCSCLFMLMPGFVVCSVSAEPSVNSGEVGSFLVCFPPRRSSRPFDGW
eukprot:7792264-Alexandrium_andersonii.AAC.1